MRQDQCRSCGHLFQFGHAEGCFVANGVMTMPCNPSKLPEKINTKVILTDAEKQLAQGLKSGFYIAELRHPLHKKQRIVVEICKSQFVENNHFGRRNIRDGLDNCYILYGYIHLDVLSVEQILNDVQVKYLTQ